MKIVIEIPEETYEALVINQYCGTRSNLENIIVNGTPLPEGHSFIAICDNDYPLSEEVIGDLKDTVFVGDTDDSGKVKYCFTMEEIIDGSDSE